MKTYQRDSLWKQSHLFDYNAESLIDRAVSDYSDRSHVTSLPVWTYKTVLGEHLDMSSSAVPILDLPQDADINRRADLEVFLSSLLQMI